MTEPEKIYAERPNKTQNKREMRALNDLGKQLVAMPDNALRQIEMGETLMAAVLEAKRLSRGALQRQLRRIATLLIKEDADHINLEVQRYLQPDRETNAVFHKLETWRDRLVAGDDALLSQIIDEFPDADRQHFRQLVRNAVAERKAEKPPKHFRILFKYLRSLHED